MNLDQYVEAYEKTGYVVIPGLLSADETAQLRAVTDALQGEALGAEGETTVFDFEPGHRPEAPVIQRIKKPHRVNPYYFDLAGHPAILGFLKRVIGADIRLSHSKINMKAAQLGSALEWHQDWAFAPHTNMSTCVASVMVDSCAVENGAMQVIPGSHQGPLFNHHGEDGFFNGAIAPQDLDLTVAKPLTGPAGTVAFHHPKTVHGSGLNQSGGSRRILFLEYAASDAFPLFYNVDWAEYNSRLVSGPQSSFVRVEPNEVKLPFPTRAGSSIYKIQATAAAKFFAA
ncbi:MAG TPA: phytanoyl-CoA dioxygenase family protein [Caulobacteraceae bacterium]|nr:phytanoyl-CoA dioxygenase family protein [Caulobacteraceae bacterium]